MALSRMMLCPGRDAEAGSVLPRHENDERCGEFLRAEYHEAACRRVHSRTRRHGRAFQGIYGGAHVSSGQ